MIAEIDQDAKTWQGILMEFVPGHHLAHFDNQLIDQLSALQAKIHRLGLEFAQGRIVQAPKVLKETTFHRLLADKRIDNPRIQELLDRARNYEVTLSPTLLTGWSHFDFDPDNILFDESNKVVAVLDFDDTTYMPLVVCLGYTLWDLFVSENDLAKVHRYQENYERSRPLSDEEKALLPKIMLFRHYVVSTVDLLFGRSESPTENEMLGQEKSIQQISFI